MPYSSQVRVNDASGAAAQVNVSLTLWELSDVINGSGHIHEHQTDQDSTSVVASGGVPVGFSFVRGPSFSSNQNHDISLAAYQSGLPGPMFRSGRMSTLPAGAPGNPDALVDVMLIDQQRFTMAAINAAIPTPMTLQDGTVVKTATITSAPPSRSLTLVATGPYGATTYTYTLSFTIDPWDDEFDLTHVLGANAAGTGSVVLTAGLGGGVQAFIDNLFSFLFVNNITSQVLSTVTSRLNATAAAAGASAAAMAGAPSGLPPGVILGVRNIGVASNGDLVMSPAIGTFGSIVDKFLAASPAGQSKCFVATAVHGADSVEVATLRAFRDDSLLKHALGRALVGCYETISPALATGIRKSALLRALARRLIVAPAYAMARRFRS